MGQIDIYECDRCKKDFRMKAGEEPTVWKTTYKAEPQGEWVVCTDCDASFSFFIDNFKRFDALAEKIAVEQSGEAEPIKA